MVINKLPPFAILAVSVAKSSTNKTQRDCLSHISTEIRTADELVQMIAHFYYNAKRPSCVNPEAVASF